MSRPLEGVRVLDLTRLLPGPLATLALADLGARVDKIEDPGPGDYLRHMPPQHHGINGAFLALNRDKRAGVLDLKSPGGQGALLRMARSYDVLVESFRPGVLARLGLSHERLLQENPRLIVCAITGYGQDGPLVDRAGHDLNYLARAGVLAVTGPADGPPAVSGAQMADVAGGSLWAISGILAALFARERTGKGRVVDVAMCEGAVPLAAFAMGSVLAEQKSPPRGAHFLDGGIAPYNTYQTSDGRFVALGALEPKFWTKFCAVVGLEASMQDLAPGPHQRELKARVSAIIATRTRDEWAAIGAANDCCLEPVLAPEELASDPQHRARGMFFELEGGRYFRTPLATRDALAERAHQAGADTDAILSECGFSADEIAALRESGAVR
ncbi:MAG: CoA transferase [Myxococcales bacterium]|nr:CoA transferase [Myxococcales bacterium]